MSDLVGNHIVGFPKRQLKSCEYVFLDLHCLPFCLYHSVSFNSLYFQLVGISSQIERTTSEQKIKLQHIEGDTGQQMAHLDQRTRQIIDDLKNNITTYQSHSDVEREKLEGKLQTALESQAQIRDSLIVS